MIISSVYVFDCFCDHIFWLCCITSGAFVTFFFGRRDNEASTSMRRRQARPTFKITYWSVFAEWISTGIALSLLSFYSFALISSPPGDEDSLSFKLLSANVILSVYMRICYIMQSISKTYVLVKNGPIDTTVLPLQAQINSFSCLMGFVEPGHFVCLCWITHIAFPFKLCEDLSSESSVCTALHITSTIFISMWIFTGLAFILLFACFARWDRNGGRNGDISNTLRMAPIPDHIREGIINSLPISNDAPEDGEVCAICCDRELDDQHPTQWSETYRFKPLF
jgi:magnesium-transporting ATPase (P-type)